jgi:hypothetical protein
VAPSSRATFLCNAQRIDVESGCYRFHPTGHQAATFRPIGMLWSSLERKSQCFLLSSSELLLQFCHCMLILGRVAEESCYFLHRIWWILRPNAAPEWQARSYCYRTRLEGGLYTRGACWATCGNQSAIYSYQRPNPLLGRFPFCALNTGLRL